MKRLVGLIAFAELRSRVCVVKTALYGRGSEAE
jgi:hypothetical protein